MVLQAQADPLLSPWFDAVRRDPNATAVVDGDRAATRSDILERAIGVAARLEALPAVGGRNPVVLVRGRKSIGAVVAILGALLSGRAYAYIDDRTPPDAAAAILDLLKPAAILATDDAATTDDSRMNGVGERNDPRMVAVGACAPGHLAWLGSPQAALPAGAGDIAYVLFSSGSTGIPKGVCMARDAAAAAVSAYCRDLGIGASDVVGNSVSFCFDVSMFDILAAARTGARLVLLHDGAAGVEGMGQALAESGATVAFTVPSTAGAMVAAAVWPSAVSGLRVLGLTGERVSPKFRDTLSSGLGPDTTVWNLFGGTEMPYVLAERLALRSKGDPSRFTWRDDPVSVGLDGDFSDAVRAEGREGELWVRGVPVLSGYLIPGERWPSETPAPRTHASGDIFRVVDGRLHYLGRRDRQVRLQGFRVELDMVEAWVERHPSVSDCIAFPDERNKCLAIFVERDRTARADGVETDHDLADAILGHMRHGLPAYLLPRTCRVLNALPRTHTGKKDRKAVEKELGPSRTTILDTAQPIV